MTLKVEELQSLVDLTDAESSEINGGYTGIIIGDTGNPVLAARAAALVLGKANTRSLFNEQLRLGIPRRTVEVGVAFANTAGGRYTLLVTSAKLED